MNDTLTYNGKSAIIKHYQNVGDIMNQVEAAHNLHCMEYDKLSDDFRQGDINNTASTIWRYCKKNIPYVEEPKEDQTTKSPAAILIAADKYNKEKVGGNKPKYDRELGGIDCKHYSLFSGGIIDSLKSKGLPVDWAYRFVSYYPDDRNLHHVFVVLFPGTNKEIFIDPVLSGYDLKKRYYYFCDVKPESMLRHVSGVGAHHHHKHHMPKWFDKFSDSPLNPLHPGIYTPGLTQKLVGAKKHHGLKLHLKLPPVRLGNMLLHVANAPSRNSFLLLLKLNVFNMAQKLYAHGAGDHSSAYWQKLSKLWKKIGGNPNKLSTAINMGYQKHRFHNAKKAKRKGTTKMSGPYHYTDEMASVGVVQVAGFAAIIAAATPIIAALKSLLKSAGVDTAKLHEAGAQGAEALHGHASKKQNAGEDEDGGDGGGGDDGSDTTGKAAVTAVHNADGSKTLHIHDVNAGHGPETDDSDGAPDSGGGGDDQAAPGQDGTGPNVPISKPGGVLQTVEDKAKNFVTGHRGAIIYGSAATVAVIGVVKAVNGPKKRKTGVLIGSLVLAAAVAVGGNMLIPKE